MTNSGARSAAEHRVVITATNTPHHDTILKHDLAFHLGDRDRYELGAIRSICESRSAPGNTFVAFRPGRRASFFAGEFYRRHCRFSVDTLTCDVPNLVDRNVSRTIASINQDISLMDRDVTYCFDMQDRRETDYATYFGTDKPIPVFQYHRRRGLAAVVQPLRYYHQYPSPNIPVLTDDKSFGSKRAKMFWRGSPHGTVQTGDSSISFVDIINSRTLAGEQRLELLRRCIRYSVCAASLDNETLDAGLLIPWGGPMFPVTIPEVANLCRPKADRAEHLEFKYLLSIDGYDGSSSHYWMLGTNSLVFRQESDWQMFADCYFLPWVHYVPISSDGLDLFEKFDWCERNQPACEQMVANAKRAWSILFDERYQVERRKALMRRYAKWLRRN